MIWRWAAYFLLLAGLDRLRCEHSGAGGDLCLICHREDYITNAYEELVSTAERDAKFARQVEDAAARVMAFKKKSRRMLRAGKPPSPASVGKLSRKLWEFSEQVRLENMNREENARYADDEEKHDRGWRHERHFGGWD